MNVTTKATLAVVDFGFCQVEGLMLPDGTYAIAVSQANKFLNFDTSQNNESRTVKSILGKDSKLVTVKTELTKNKNYVLTIPQFKDLIFELATKRNHSVATAFLKATLEETIERRFDIAFGNKVDEEERSRLLSLRMSRLLARRQWTDVIRDRYLELYGEKPSPEQYKEWTILVNQVLFNRDHFFCDRDTMNTEQQELIERFEFMCVRKSKQLPLANPEVILEKALACF